MNLQVGFTDLGEIGPIQGLLSVEGFQAESRVDRVAGNRF